MTSGGSRAERVSLERMLRHVRRGDTVRVASMDRLARSVVDLAQLVTELTELGVRVEFVAERLAFDPDWEDSFATFQLHLPGAVAQLERSLIRERQREGIELAKTKGVYRGRGRKLAPDQVTEAARLAAAGVPKKPRSPETWAAPDGCFTTPWPPAVPTRAQQRLHPGRENCIEQARGG